MAINSSQRFFAVSSFKVSNKHLSRHSIFKDCLEPDVHHMRSQILSILIDFILDWALFVPFFGSTKNGKRQSF